MIGALWNTFWIVPLYAASMTATVLFGRLLARKEEKDLGMPRQCRVGPFERSVGAMLAFLIGFTFAISGSNFREAQATQHREAESLAEAHRWSYFLPETDRKWLQDSLRAHTDLLVHRDANWTGDRPVETAHRDIRSKQAELWEELAARRSGAADRASYDACLRALNQFIQASDLCYYLDRRRLADVMVLFILGATLLIGFLVGYTSELQGRHFAVMAGVFVLFITTTVYLIWEVDRPNEGLILTNRQSLTDLAERLRGYHP